MLAETLSGHSKANSVNPMVKLVEDDYEYSQLYHKN